MAEAYRLSSAALVQLDDIYIYTRDGWGEGQAKQYIQGFFDRFQAIADKQAISRPIQAEFGVTGFYIRYEHHYIYWKELGDGTIGIAEILHERMNLGDRLTHSEGLNRED